MTRKYYFLFAMSLLLLVACQAQEPALQCTQDSDCETPMDYLIRSNCPFGSACIENTCAVVCPFVEHAIPESINESYPVSCEKDSDCDCSKREPKTKACVCHNKACVSVE